MTAWKGINPARSPRNCQRWTLEGKYSNRLGVNKILRKKSETGKAKLTKYPKSRKTQICV